MTLQPNQSRGYQWFGQVHLCQLTTPLKLQSKTCLDLQQIMIPMVHPTTGETITSYKQLMHNPDTAESWQTPFGKDFDGMARGNNKMGQNGTNSIFVMTHDEIPLIPWGQTATYARVVINYRPQKANPHPIWITVGGNLINTWWTVNEPGRLGDQSRRIGWICSRVMNRKVERLWSNWCFRWFMTKDQSIWGGNCPYTQL